MIQEKTLTKQLLSHANSEETTLPDALDKPPTRQITMIVFGCFLFLITAAIIAKLILFKASENLENGKNLGMGSAARVDYMKQEKLNLSRYKKIDKDHYQIPIGDAMTIVVEKQGNVFH